MILNIVLISQSRTQFDILQKHYCNNNIKGSCLNKQYASAQDIKAIWNRILMQNMKYKI